MSKDAQPRPLVERAKKDSSRDRDLADELRDTAAVGELHAMVVRLIDERRQLAEAFDAIVIGTNMLREAPPQPSNDAIASLERVATLAIEFARETVRAVTRTPPEATS